MTEAEGVVGLDRLPWLADEPRVRKGRSRVLPSAFAAILIVAAAAYWLGIAVFHLATPAAFQPEPTLPSATVPLPQARPVLPPPLPQRTEPIEPVVAAPIAIPEPKAVHAPSVQRLSVKRVVAAVTDSPSAPKLADSSSDDGPMHIIPQLWPVHVVDGASGRLIRVGAFASTHEAKKGWSAITHVNPALEHLPALVVPVRSLRDGEVYYRLQMGTTSQAHSTVLCQRMRMIAQSCVVIGLGGEGSEVAI
ncbi:hypothetical protein [Sphingomonas sp.]|uniref:hypothetical protein n=1 Tax=Sphingomonas sp. TaxID=28214 RepID=UPI0025F4E488|nr:hypothetical protein [Sphingomonas sp.]MBV9526833.1 hypothetical protein [Sphingomonas sp.]